MTKPPTTTETIRVPAALRSVIIENDLAANDISLLLLIIERTMDNVYPVKASTALSIRHIAELNECSIKGAENSVNKLKQRNLITHEVPSHKWSPGLIGLNLDAFAPTVGPEMRSGIRSVAPVAESEAITIRRRVEDDISAIRNMMFDAINSGKEKREESLPEPFLAALYLDHFGSPSAVQQFLEQIHADAKTRRSAIQSYAFYKFAINRARDGAVYERFVDSIRITEQVEMPVPVSFRGAGSQPEPRKPSFENWVIQVDDRADQETLLEAALMDISATTEIAGDPCRTGLRQS